MSASVLYVYVLSGVYCFSVWWQHVCLCVPRNVTQKKNTPRVPLRVYFPHHHHYRRIDCVCHCVADRPCVCVFASKSVNHMRGNYLSLWLARWFGWKRWNVDERASTCVCVCVWNADGSVFMSADLSGVARYCARKETTTRFMIVCAMRVCSHICR